jgi:hypothetical protein
MTKPLCERIIAGIGCFYNNSDVSKEKIKTAFESGDMETAFEITISYKLYKLCDELVSTFGQEIVDHEKLFSQNIAYADTRTDESIIHWVQRNKPDLDFTKIDLARAWGDYDYDSIKMTFKLFPSFEQQVDMHKIVMLYMLRRQCRGENCRYLYDKYQFLSEHGVELSGLENVFFFEEEWNIFKQKITGRYIDYPIEIINGLFFLMACRHCDIKFIKLLLQKYPNLDVSYDDGQGMIMAIEAQERCNPSKILTLIEFI